MSFRINELFNCPISLSRLYNCGFLSTYLDLFAEWMKRQKFADDTMQKHISCVAHFSYSLGGIKPDIQDINPYIQHFLKNHIPVCTCKGWKKPQNKKVISYSINRFKNYLSECCGIHFKSKNLPYSEVHNEYCCWLSEKFRLADSTITIRSNYLKQFFKWYQETSNNQLLQCITPFDVETFYIHATQQCEGKAYKRSLQSTLRSFFDFCYEQGYTSQNLRFSLPSIRVYRNSDVPKKIEYTEAIKLIDSIDRSTLRGKRAYAIILILNTYGIRGCQLRALEIQDIDWYKDEIHFPAVKNGKSCSFPLTAKVGNALLDYLKYARHKCQYKEVFMTARAPFRPLTNSNNLSQIIRSEILLSGIESPSKGTHCFRHGFIYKMLKQGESFKHIADLVGHKNIQTTYIYTKIDFASLADVALELPEADYETC